MEIEKSSKTVLKFGEGVYTNIYVSSYSENVEIDLQATDENGIVHHYEIFLPLGKAEKLSQELSGDIAGYHEEQRRREEERAAEEAEAEV